ncbi:IclR family transcriptional regulator [Granulicella sp. WH15]|uniref:IclR family transcriptional regulator n=1 Tax=Granulicella sp. WH15 TaxID=2602070 RepID=UPI001367490D|nr:IclR family transcriptional regulator [Granulicella sp. WH15]QHN04208.1 IclR family transcriptional regulator [Granulicella sp. WH15]
MPIKKPTAVPFIQSLDRGLVILQSVARSKQPISLGELADLLQIDRSSAFRLAQTLRRRGFLACPAGRKDYILGPAMWTLSHQYDWSNMLVRVAHEQLKLIANELNETAHLAVREGKNALFIDSANANHVISVAGQTGELVPLYCTAHGKALLADADEKELKSQFGIGPLTKHTPSTISTVKALTVECKEIHARGYATDEAEYNPGMRCVAAPIRLEDGSIVGSIGISAPEARFPKEHYAKYAKKISMAAREIGLQLSMAEPKE